MDYEQKYKEALEKLQEALAPTKDGCKISGLTRGCIEYIFPELKESKGDRIKWEILEYINSYANLKDEKIPTEWIEWLEKQGEQKPYGQRKKCSNCQFNYAGECKGFCQMKKDEQKPADNVEPKFKVGDWISGYYTNYKVTAINSKGYMVEDTDGTKMNILFENEKFHHLWTIQDAKDGDVLSGETDGEVFIFLFNQIQDKWIVAHGYYSETDGGFIEKAYLHKYHLFSPATKEQQDLLFQKIKEAGYEWNNEKKELKKAEFKTFNEWLDEYNKRRKNAK